MRSHQGIAVTDALRLALIHGVVHPALKDQDCHRLPQRHVNILALAGPLFGNDGGGDGHRRVQTPVGVAVGNADSLGPPSA